MKNNIIFKLIVATLLLCKLTFSQRYEIKLKRTFKNELLLPICVGTPCQLLYLKLLTSTNMIWISNKNIFNHGFNPFLSRTLHQITTPYSLTYKGQRIVCALIDETLSFENPERTESKLFSVDKVMLYLAESGNIENDYDGVIGIGSSNPSDNSKSFFDLMYSTKGISHQIVEISHNKIVIGDTEHKEKIKYCSYIIDQSTLIHKTYQCIVNMVYITNKRNLLINKEFSTIPYIEPIEGKNKITFKLGANVILCPLEYFNFIVDEIFPDLFSQRICTKSNDGSLLFVVCYSSINSHIETMGMINIIIGNISISLNPRKLFRNSGEEEYILFEIMHDQSEDNRDQWIFGIPILKEYNLILDNENKKVGLVHNNS